MSNSKARVHLIVPGLFDAVKLNPAMMPKGTFPGLEKILSRAGAGSHSHLDFPSLVFDVIGLPLSSTADVPVAALECLNHLSEEQVRQNCWVEAKPVFLKPDRDALLAFPADFEQIDFDVLSSLGSTALKHFEDVFDDLVATSDRQVFIRLKLQPDIKTCQAEQIYGRHIEQFLPQGKDAPGWRSLMNEWQMLLHSSDVEINGFNFFWLQGVGSLPEKISSTKIQQICSNHSLMKSVSKYLKLGIFDLNDLDWSRGDALLAFHNVEAAVQMQSTEAWMAAMKQLDEILNNLLLEMKKGRLSGIDLSDTEGHLFCFDRSSQFKFWSGSRSVSDFV